MSSALCAGTNRHELVRSQCNGLALVFPYKDAEEI
jgi:hypothetical protein